jgi:hypothetical protein
VVTIQNGQFVVSWGGLSDWQVLNPNPANIVFLPSAITAMAVGDFDGDGVSDIFYADGQTWWVSYGGNTPFMPVQTSSYRVKDLRFGDFDDDRTTDIFSVGSEEWQVSYSSPGVRVPYSFSSWQLLRTKLTDTIQGLVVPDFNGDGFADVATDGGCTGLSLGSLVCDWLISYGGTSGWNSHSEPAPLSSAVGIGRFFGGSEADVLLWNGIPLEYSGACGGGPDDVLCIVAGGTGMPLLRSHQVVANGVALNTEMR